MVYADHTSTGCTLHEQTALAGIPPSGFIPSSGSDVVRSNGSRLLLPLIISKYIEGALSRDVQPFFPLPLLLLPDVIIPERFQWVRD